MDMLESYAPTEITKILHTIPHLSFKFILLENPSFTLDDAAYLESLAIIALMPVVLLLLTMLGFLIYYCCVGVKRAAPNKNNSSACYCSVCLMIVFIMIALGGVSVGVYGSIQVHEGVASATSATSEINQSFSTITNEVEDIRRFLSDIELQTSDLNEMLINNSNVDTLNEVVLGLSSNIVLLPDQNGGANDRLEWTIYLFQMTEWYRTIITFSLIGCHGLVCILGLLGVCCRSKCLLISTTFVGLVCLVVSYLYIGTLLMINVAVADLCMDPYTYIKEQAVQKLYMDNATAQYYLTCSKAPTAVDPYSDVMTRALEGVAELNNVIMEFGNNEQPDSVELVLDQMHESTHQLETRLDSLSGHLGCKIVHTSLEDFVPAICGSTLEGLFIIGIAVLCICFALTAVLCATPKTWKRFSKAVTRDELDLDDVFLPATTRPAVSRTNNPLYVAPEDRYSRRISSNTNLPVATNSLSFFRRSEEDVTLLEQPPPEYSPPRPGSNFNGM